MRRLSVVFAASLVFACGEKPSPILSNPNNDSSNNTSVNNIDAQQCVTAAQCAGGDCVDGKCVGRDNSTPNGRTNNVSPNNTNNNATNNATNTNNGTIAPPVACDDTGGADRFTVVENSGVEVTFAASPAMMQSAAVAINGGIALVDFDGDDDLDVMVSNQGEELTFFTNDGSGAFTNATITAGLAGLTLTTSLSVADLDGDGDSDVVAGRTTGGAYVLENRGAGVFSDVSATWQIGDPGDVVSAGTFADFDGDGDLDFYMGNYTTEASVRPAALADRLYRNDGDRFREITTSPGVAMPGVTHAAAWWDYDADGRPDIWTANDYGMTATPNQLWRNVGPDPQDPDNWLFEDVSARANVAAPVFGMSTTLGDFDNDGDEDGYVANMANNILHVLEAGTTTDEAVARGVASSVLPDPRPRPVMPPNYFPLLPEMTAFMNDYADASSGMYTLTSWSSIFFDADHDGWLDLFVANGAVLTGLTPEATNQPNYLYLNQQDGTFDRDPCYAIPDVRGSSRGAAVGDIDGDGDMDLLWVDTGINGTPGVIVARNEMAAGNWLTVRLVGQSPNTDAIGARVVLQAGGSTQTRWIDGGQSFLSVSERVAHFGLGTNSTVDSLQVVWPDGTTQSVPVNDVNERLVVQQ